MWSLATSGSHFCFCSSEPNSISGSATPIDWCAESSVASDGVPGAGQRERLVVVDLREAEAAVLLGHLHAERAELLEAVDDRVGDLRVALDLERVDVLVEERAQRAPGTPRPSRRPPASSLGCGWIRSSRKLPRNSSLPKLGSFQSCSRAASATWRACCSLTWVDTSFSLQGSMGSGTSWYPARRGPEACSLDAPWGARSWPSWRRPPRRRCSCARRRATTRGRGCCGGARSPRGTLSTVDGPAFKPLPVAVCALLAPLGERRAGGVGGARARGRRRRGRGSPTGSAAMARRPRAAGASRWCGGRAGGRVRAGGGARAARRRS